MRAKSFLTFLAVAAVGAVAHADDINQASTAIRDMRLSQLEPGRAPAVPQQPARKPDLSAATTVSSPHPIVGVLATMGKEYIGESARWQFADKIGQSISAQYDKLSGELSKLGKIGFWKDGKFVGGAGDYFDVAFDVGNSVKNSNGLLEERKFSIRLQPPGENDAVSAAATLVIKEDWADRGDSVGIEVRGERKPAAYLRNAGFMRSTKHDFVIARLETVGKDGKRNKFYLTPYDGKFPADSATAVLDKAREISGNWSLAAVPAYKGVAFPKADYAHTDKTLLRPGRVVATHKDRAGAPYKMGQFLFEQKIKIHEKGISLEAAAAGGAVRASAPMIPAEAFVINDSYLFWIDVNGVIPFAGLITPKDMKQPAN
ncbi:MAG: hypothetical protein HY078_08955 [Elusimicrobia bacterium]|nr:hypothetical protein [Elusimicrobiota bacterium]